MSTLPSVRNKLVLSELWKDVPFYGRQRLLYSWRSRRTSDWVTSPEVVRLREYDVKLEVLPGDALGKFLFLYGTWEISSTRLVQAVLDAGATFVDIGANVGYYSLVASRLVGPSGFVHSFEPEPMMRVMLERNLTLNAARNVTVHPEAVTASTGPIHFYRSADPSNFGVASTVRGPTPLGQVREREGDVVAGVSLDDFVAERVRGSVDFLKIDVEGAEQAVLDGGRSLLSRPDAPIVLFESFDLSQPLKLLTGLDFVVRQVHYSSRHGIRLAALDARPDHGVPDYVAIKREQLPAVEQRARGFHKEGVRGQPVGWRHR